MAATDHESYILAQIEHEHKISRLKGTIYVPHSKVSKSDSLK